VSPTLPLPIAETRRLRALVVEDEWPARNYLVELLDGSGLAEVIGAVADAEEAYQALHAESALPIDVAFVDVQLAGRGEDRAGLELIRSMQSSPRAPSFVLATAFDGHALEAFDLGVLDYLLKPFTEERVAQCLQRVRERLPVAPVAPTSTRIVARRKKSLVFLEPSEILAFEAADRLTFVHTPHGRFDLDLSLAAIEASLGRTLTRVHRNWLVNVSHIKELDREGNETKVLVAPSITAESEGLYVPVARDRATALRDMLLANATGVRRL
jgi:DNA-binding LytR/AlgR family response regulator